MTIGSPESTAENKKQLHISHRRAAEAMMRIIALRDVSKYRSPNLDPDSYEGSVRQRLFALQHQALEADPKGEYAEPLHRTLAESLMNPYLSDMAQPGRPLTQDRLVHLNPELRDVADRMNTLGVGWPDDETVFQDVLPEDFDDYAFGRRLADRGRAYNNFPAILTASPSLPEAGESMIDYMNNTKLFQYASKPYLIRAHALQPEFMGSLQAIMEIRGSTDQWAESLYRAATDEDPDPEDQILLRASRMSYQLLINLMRKDDLQIQARLLTMSMHREITDPIEELWT